MPITFEKELLTYDETSAILDKTLRALTSGDCSLQYAIAVSRVVNSKIRLEALAILYASSRLEVPCTRFLASASSEIAIITPKPKPAPRKRRIR